MGHDKNTKELAHALIEEIREEKHEFWIDGERHYQQHEVLRQLDIETVVKLKELVDDYDKAKGIGFTMFIRLVVAGAIIFAMIGFEIPHKLMGLFHK